LAARWPERAAPGTPGLPRGTEGMAEVTGAAGPAWGGSWGRPGVGGGLECRRGGRRSPNGNEHQEITPAASVRGQLSPAGLIAFRVIRAGGVVQGRYVA